MSDLLEKDQFISLDAQKENRYYIYKIYKVKKEIKKYFESSNILVLNCLDVRSGKGIISYGIGDKINDRNLNWSLVDSNYTKNDLNLDYRKSIESKFNQKYEIIIGFDVLEHIEDERIFLRSLHDCMQEDSILIMTIPAKDILWSNHDIFLKKIISKSFRLKSRYQK